jgi:hypothetical protein
VRPGRDVLHGLGGRLHEVRDALLRLHEAQVQLGDLLRRALERELRAHAREDDGEVEGLGDVVVRAERERLDDALAAVPGRRHDHGARHREALADSWHLEFADPRHHHVEEQAVEVLLPHEGQRLVAVLGHLHGIARTHQTAAEEVAVQLVVVHHEDAAQGLGHRRGGGFRGSAGGCHA